MRSSIEVPLKHVLWSTRGTHWDYTFLLTPVCRELLGFDRWYTLAEKQLPQGMSQGALAVGSRNIEFVAAVWTDRKRTDSFGRHIEDRIIWFVGIGGGNSVSQRELPDDWAKQIVKALERQPCLRELNAMSEQQIKGVSPASYFQQHLSLTAVNLTNKRRGSIEAVTDLGILSLPEYKGLSGRTEETNKLLIELLGEFSQDVGKFVRRLGKMMLRLIGGKEG